MTRDDFLRQIRISLNGKVSPEVIDDSVRYYDNYIMMQMRKGQSEEEVLASLGDPRLLAKSIAAAKSQKTEKAAQGTNEYSAEDEFTSGRSKKWQSLKQEFANMPKWMRILILIGIAIVVGVLIMLFLGAILAFLPVALVLVGLAFLINYIRKNFKL